MKVRIVGIPGKLGQYMTQHALERGYEVIGVCRPQSVAELDRFKGRITVDPGETDDARVIKGAVAGCDGILVMLVPWGMHGYATGSAQAVLDHAPAEARLVFSCGWHITRDGQDRYSRPFAGQGEAAGLGAPAEPSGQPRGPGRSDAAHLRQRQALDGRARQRPRRGRQRGPAGVAPTWGRPMLQSNRTRHIDFALFMVDALQRHELVHEAPATWGCQTPSALAHAAAASPPTAAARERSG